MGGGQMKWWWNERQWRYGAFHRHGCIEERKKIRKIKRSNWVLCGRCPGYWGKDSTRHGYYGEHINEWSPKLCSPSDTIYTQLCSPSSVVRASKTSWRCAGQESGSHTKRWVECVRRIGHRPRKTKETNCAHSSVSLLDIFTHRGILAEKNSKFLL